MTEFSVSDHSNQDRQTPFTIDPTKLLPKPGRKRAIWGRYCCHLPQIALFASDLGSNAQKEWFRKTERPADVAMIIMCIHDAIMEANRSKQSFYDF
jgi:hypothetical protein